VEKFGKGPNYPLMTNDSAFMHLYRSGHDDALITLCGFDHASFSSLLALFQPYFDKCSSHVDLSSGGFMKQMKSQNGKRLGRPRLVTAVMVLGLV
jgi:hypothetical protein